MRLVCLLAAFSALLAAQPAPQSPSLLMRSVSLIDGRGLFLLPGLTDAHVHLSGMPWAERAEQLKQMRHGGVTMVYDVASDLRTSDLSRCRRCTRSWR